MKRNSVLLGIFFIFIGLFWLLSNMGIITWSIWEAVVDLWPLVFIVIGVSIIFNDRKIIKNIVWVLFLFIILAYGFFIQYDEDQSYKVSSPSFELQSDKDLKNAELNLNLSGVNFKLDSTENKLINTYISCPYVEHNVEYKNNKETAIIDFSERKHGTFVIGNKVSDNATFNLSDKVIWDIKGNIGGINGKIDLSNIKARSFDIDFGAGKLDIVLGNLLEKSDIKIDAGATSLKLIIPNELGVMMHLDEGINHSNLNELGWKRTSDYYISPNYNEAESKVDIDIDIGVGNLFIDIQ